MLLLASCTSKNPAKKTVSHSDETKMEMANENLSNISFQVDGMTCEVGCAARIEKKVAAMEGVAMSKVDFEAKTAYISFDPATTSFDNVKATIESLGDDYKVGEATSMPAFTFDHQGKKKKLNFNSENDTYKNKIIHLVHDKPFNIKNNAWQNQAEQR